MILSYCLVSFVSVWGTRYNIFYGGGLIAKSCLTLVTPWTVCKLPGSSVHGILQARILEWSVISFSRGSSQPRNWTPVSCITGRFFTNWAMRILREHFLQGWTTADKLPLSFSFGNVLISPSFLQDIFIRYRILGWQFSSFSTYICHLTGCWPLWLWKEISL